MKRYIAAIDAGTGGVRCVLYDAGGRAVGRDYRELLTRYTPDGRAEQDPVQLVRGAWDAVRGALVRSGVDPADVAGLSVTGVQTSFVPVDRDGNFLTQLLLWQDLRGAEMFDWMRGRLAEAGMDEAALYRRTLRPLDGILAGAKLLWLRAHAPGVYRRIHRLLNPQAVLLRAFGAEKPTLDVTDAGWWLCQDAVSLATDAELASVFDVDPGLLPPLRRPGEQVGEVSADAAARTGLRRGTPLFQGAVDQCCAALGAGNAGEAGLGTLCMGTVGLLMTWSEAPAPDPRNRYYVIHYPTGGFASELTLPAAASAFRWVRDMLWPAGAFEQGDVYRRMDAEAARAPIGAGGVAFLPHLAGCVYPEMNAAARGGWIGASMGTTRAELVRAALEGIAFGMRQVIGAGGGCRRLRLLGGAARSELWSGMQADIYNCPVETVEADEASALGAAMIAAAGAGLYADLPEAVRAMTRVKRRYEPDPVRAARYDECYAAWLACAEALSPQAFEMLAGVRERGRGIRGTRE